MRYFSHVVLEYLTPILQLKFRLVNMIRERFETVHLPLSIIIVIFSAILFSSHSTSNVTFHFYSRQTIQCFQFKVQVVVYPIFFLINKFLSYFDKAIFSKTSIFRALYLKNVVTRSNKTKDAYTAEDIANYRASIFQNIKLRNHMTQ